MPIDAGIQHLHTYFLFPFSIDKQAVAEDHSQIWSKHPNWTGGLEEWMGLKHTHFGQPILDKLGGWQRAAYTRFDLESTAYQDMVFFHPYVRRVFFDNAGYWGEGNEHESLLHFYRMPLDDKKLFYEADDKRGKTTRVPVTELRLNLYANGLGILAIGVEAHNIPAAEALWINEMMRKIYPSSGRQQREGRIPPRFALTLDTEAGTETLVEERFEKPMMIGFHPPLSKIVQALLYFADYPRQEFEPVLDERMVVYTYVTVDPKSVPEDYIHSEDYQILISRLLYVDRAADGYRYDPEFVTKEMQRQLYRRWRHQGTYYGFTTYSNITVSVGLFDCDDHQLHEGFLIHRMFESRYFLVATVTLFYRVTLLDFAERTALVSRRLHQDQQGHRISTENIRLTADLRSEFLHFSNYWYFDELANKDEENEHFFMQIREYRIDVMKREVEEEIDKLNDSLHNYYQFRNTEAVNRLAMLSMILGAGAVVTGFFGMNFGGTFASTFFNPAPHAEPLHFAALGFVVLFAMASIAFGVYVVVSNWADYRESLLPRWWVMRKDRGARSLKRG